MMWCLSSRPSLVLQRRRFKLETTTTRWDDADIDDECEKHNRAETIVNYALESGKDVVVADVGCGHGQMSLLLHSRGVKRVIGIDKSQNEVNYANECLRSFRRKSTSASESGESGDDDDDEHQKTKNPFKELIIVSPDSSDEWSDAQPTMVINDLPTPEIFNPDKIQYLS